MNINPLKNDNNTDALVKALEDANNMGGADNNTTDNTAVADNSAAAIAADPQVTGAGTDTSSSDESTSIADTPSSDNNPADTSAQPEGSSSDSTSSTPDVSVDNSATGIAFDDNSNLPEGLSSDAQAHVDTPSATGDNEEIDVVKKSALEQLRPLIEKIDLEPTDKFDKYLMMLRASDDPTLIKPAFTAAEGITNEEQKAQALLDIINEINYISSNTQKAESETSETPTVE